MSFEKDRPRGPRVNQLPLNYATRKRKQVVCVLCMRKESVADRGVARIKFRGIWI